MYYLRPLIYLAEKMGKGLGRSEILQREMQAKKIVTAYIFNHYFIALLYLFALD